MVILCSLPLAAYSTGDDSHHGKFGLGINMNLQPQDLEMDFYPGFHIRLRFNETIGIAAELNIRSDSTEFTVADITSQPVSFMLMYFLLPKSVLGIYVLGGVTFTKPSVEYTDVPGPSEEEGEWEQGLFGGLGLEIAASPNLVIHGEIRYIDLDFAILDFDVDYSGLNYSIGISYYL